MFSLVCPDCGGQLAVDGDATAACRSCRRQFIVRLGHLIPTSIAVRQTATERGSA
jgi:hypothetical protein